ncbi:hypothetical protein GGG16DRAFT_67121 [Schizophyllum commune]
MTTAGEKRYYVVALMNALMAHLPGDWTVGLLYDIACQTHASALKWGLFDEYVERLMFAVSVFHAYGHEIGCQVLYHPRKRIGYGLSDGEGCERFWSSISKFISYLRVAGYHLRLYTLDLQMQHIAATSLFEGAAWLARKRLLLEGKRKEANAWLSECGRFADDLPYLREQWRQQEVEAALELKKLVKDAEQRVEDATAGCGPDRPSKGDSRSPAEKDADVAAAKANLRAALTKYERKVAQLGVDAKAKLERMRTNKALLCRAQCLILLRQARAAISKRKMELERVNAYHQTNKNGDNALRRHVSTSVDRRSSSVKNIVQRYNKACEDLRSRIDATIKRQGHCSVRPLDNLPDKGIWDLDIDNPCWDELRYDLDEDEDAPQWMVNPDVRKGIRAVLILDRCDEEAVRLQHEERNLRSWFYEEWEAVRRAIKGALNIPDAPALIHQLFQRRKQLLRLAVKWGAHLTGLDGPPSAILTSSIQEWAMASCDLPARTTRQGTCYSDYIPLPVDVDLASLVREAVDQEADDPVHESDAETDFGDDDWQRGGGCTDSRASSPLTPISDSEDDGNPSPPPHFDDSSLPRPREQPPITVSGGNSAQRKKKRQRKQRRQEKERDDAASKRRRAMKIAEADEEPIAWNLDDAPCTSTGFTALPDASRAGISALESFKDYTYINWDGIRQVALTVGEDQTVICVLVGQPPVPDWDERQRHLAQEMEDAAGRMTFAAEDREHRRGFYRLKSHGLSHGGGQKSPRPLKHRPNNKAELDGLLNQPAAKQLAHLCSSAFKNWESDVYQYYHETMEKLFNWRPVLRKYKNFPKSVFACMTANLGPQTITIPHRDYGNLCFGFCSITALGWFDPDLGGHLVIEPLRVVIRFPPGSSILVPSAMLMHCNTPIAPHERRYTITQYTAGAIFRFVEHGFQSNKQFYSALTPDQLAAAIASDKARAAEGRARLSKLPDLVAKASSIRAEST